MEHGKHRGGLERCPIVAVEHGLVVKTVDPFRERRTPRKRRGMIRIIGVGDRGAHDLAAVEIGNEIESKPTSCDLGRSIRHIPAPDLAGGGRHMGGRRACGPWCLVPAPVTGLPCRAQDPAEGRFTGEIYAFIGQLRHDPRRRHGCKAWCVGYLQNPRAFGRRQGMGRGRTRGLRTPVSLREA